MHILTGFHPIDEQLRLFKKNDSVPSDAEIQFTQTGPRVKKLIAFARELQIPCIETPLKELDTLVSTLHKTSQDHRGIVFVRKDGTQERSENFVDFDTYLAQLLAHQAKNTAGKSSLTIVLLDSVTDPHNVGAVIRSCDQLGSDLLVLPEHRGVYESEVVARSSAGASAWVPIAVVSNLVRIVEKLQQANFWVYAACSGGTAAHKLDLKGNVALVLGNEGNGISRLLSEKCDNLVSIPCCGKLDSLNVSVAAGILLYEVHRQKLEN